MGNRPDRQTFEKRLTEMVDTLRSEIEQGKYPPGTYLPSENGLIKQYKLSGKSVAKGLNQLESEGLIVKKHRIGNMVKRDFGKLPATIELAVQHSVYRDAALTSLLENFEKKHPNVKVNVTPFEPVLHESIADYAQTEQFDVLMLNYLNFYDITLQNRLEVLEPAEIVDGTYRFLQKGFTHLGVCYAQPFIFAPVVLCYNREHLREASVSEPDSDWTWHDLFDQARRLSESTGRYGFYFHTLSDNRWPIFLLQRGIQFDPQPSGKVRFCQTQVMDTFAFVREFMQEHRVFPPFFSANSTDANLLFDQGKVSMMMVSYWGMNDLKHSAIDYDIAPMPFFDDPANLLLCVGLAICKHAKEKEAAKLLVEYLLSEEAQGKIKEETLSIPALKSAAESAVEDQLNRPSRFALYRELIPTYRIHRDFGLPSVSLEKIRQRLKFFWPKLESAEEMCAKLEEML